MKHFVKHNGVISELVHKHVGRTAVVVGGAPSRLTDIPQCPRDAVFISANDHGVHQVRCNYICACEDLKSRLFSHGIPVISGIPMADYRIFNVPLPNSAALGGWAAWVMGCAPIIFTGVECYQGKTYPDDPSCRTSGHSLSLQGHLTRWQRLLELAPSGQFRAISGPLLQIFPLYDPDEPKSPPHPREDLIKRATGTKVEFLGTIDIGPRRYIRGTIQEITQLEERFLARYHPGFIRNHAE